MLLLLTLLFTSIQFSHINSSKKTDVNQSDRFQFNTLKDLQMKSKNGIIEFNSDLFKNFVSMDHKHRNFNLFIIFNALDKEVNCQYCGVAADAFKAMIDLLNKKAEKGPLPSFYASIDLKNNIEAFQMMKLDHVPVIVHYGPEIREPKIFENFNPTDQTPLLSFIAAQSGSKLNVQDALKPDKSHNNLILAFTVLFVLAGLIYTGVFSASAIFKNSYIWSVSIISFIVVMLSGYMWVKIRNPPFSGISGTRDVLYFLNSPQAQFGVESRIVSALNGAIVLVFLSINTITYKFDDNNKRRIAAMVLSLLYMAGHAGLFKSFAQKFPGYPLSYIF